MISGYSVVTAKRGDELATGVLAAIQAGKQPFGTPYTDNAGFLCQAMIVGAPVNEAAATGAGLAGTVGAAGTTTAIEGGDYFVHNTVLTLTAFAAGLSADNASLATGALLYTLPAGDISIIASALDLTVTLADATQTDTPEVGLGTTVGSGANATLGAVAATAENIHEGAVIGAVQGTTRLRSAKFPTGGIPLYIDNAAAHTVYLNIADGWADIAAAAALTVTGMVSLTWVRHNALAAA